MTSSEDLREIVENMIFNLRQEVSLMHKKKDRPKKFYSFNVYSEIVDFKFMEDESMRVEQRGRLV